jgi:hypothetical protein
VHVRNLLPLPSNDHCLQSRYLAAGLHVAILKFILWTAVKRNHLGNWCLMLYYVVASILFLLWWWCATLVYGSLRCEVLSSTSPVHTGKTNSSSIGLNYSNKWQTSPCWRYCFLVTWIITCGCLTIPWLSNNYSLYKCITHKQESCLLVLVWSARCNFWTLQRTELELTVASLL